MLWVMQGQDRVETPAKPTRGRKENDGEGSVRGKDAKKAKNHNRAKSGSGFQRSSLGDRRSEAEPKNEASFRTTD